MFSAVPRHSRRLAGFSALIAWLHAPPSRAQEVAQPEIVIHGELRAANETVKEPAAATTVVGEERLSTPGLGAAGALRGTPGTLVTEVGGFGARASLSLRGATAAQTPVYLGGVRLNDEVGGSADLGAVPLWFMERAEVYRGNAPIEADRLGIGGALFFEPRRPNGTFAEVGALAGSHGTREWWTAVGAGDAQSGVVAGIGLGAANNNYVFVDTKGTAFVPDDDETVRVQNADGNLLDLWVHARRRLSDAQLSLLAHHGRVERGAPDGQQIPPRVAREQLDRTLVAITARAPFGGSEQWIEARSAAVAASTRVEDPLRELWLGKAELRVEGARIEHQLAARLRLGRAALVRPTLSASTERLERDEIHELPDDRPELVARRLDVRPAVAAHLAVPESDVMLRSLVALECTSAGRSRLSVCEHAQLTGRVGPSLRVGSWFAYANLGRYVRWPTLGELFGASALVRGNPLLTRELGVTAEAGARFQSSALLDLRLDGAVFARRASDLVTYVQTEQDYFAPENRRRARVLGLELAAGFTPVAGVELDVEMTAMDARDVSPDRQLRNDLLPFQPRFIAAPRLGVTQPVSAAFRGSVFAHARYVYQANRYADRAGIAVLPEQHNVEVELGASSLEPHVSVRVRVDNVLDRSRFDSVGFPLPRRSVYAAVETRL